MGCHRQRITLRRPDLRSGGSYRRRDGSQKKPVSRREDECSTREEHPCADSQPISQRGGRAPREQDVCRVFAARGRLPGAPLVERNLTIFLFKRGVKLLIFCFSV